MRRTPLPPRPLFSPMPVFQLTAELIFPPPRLARPDGLLAVGGDLAPERLLLAYRQGIFPWFNEDDPILWWAPSPRLILIPAEFKPARRLARELRQGQFRFSLDQAFPAVIAACASVRASQGQGTWIHPEMIAAYCQLHQQGHAHSVECWAGERLVGGLYGLALGKVFFGESMFSLVANSSKAALAVLAKQLASWGFHWIDCQVKSNHLLSLGAREIPGREFYSRLEQYIHEPGDRGQWRLPEASGPGENEWMAR